jgi:dihydrofolate reductase
MLSIIVAISENRAIGKDNQLLWRLSADLKYFKELTTNHVIIMGRKTFESIGKPLPNRVNIVISRDEKWQKEGVIIENSLQKAIETAQNIQPDDEIFIIGGGSIYEQALPLAQKIFLTEVKTKLEGDTYFPTLNPDEWQEISRISHPADSKNEYDYAFVELLRKEM